jgi:hypothetical protein
MHTSFVFLEIETEFLFKAILQIGLRSKMCNVFEIVILDCGTKVARAAVYSFYKS